MALLGHAGVVAVLEGSRDVRARARVARYLEEHRLAEEHVAPRGDRRPVQPLDCEVLADGAGHDLVPLGLKAADRLHRIEAHGLLRTPVVLRVAVRVALESQGRDARLRHRRLRDAAARDADLDDSAAHRSPPFGARLPGPIVRERPVGQIELAGRLSNWLPQRVARRIIRWMRASSTSSARWFRTR